MLHRSSEHPGVNWVIPMEEFMETLPARSLGGCDLDPERHRAYTEKYLGTVDGRSSLRALGAIKAAIGTSKRASGTKHLWPSSPRPTRYP